MDCHVVRFKDVSPDTWDSWVESLDEATYLHSSSLLGYCHACISPADVHSFAILNNQQEPLAICPFGVSQSEIGGTVFNEASWIGVPLGLPAIKREFPTQRRRIVREVYEILHHEMKSHGVVYSLLERHPISVGVLHGDGLPVGQIEALSEGYFCQVQNTIIIDLSQSLEDLHRGLSREQRKHLTKSRRQGVTVTEYRGDCNGIDEMHSLYQSAHFSAAGRLTRPQESFDYMLESAKNDDATLFVALVNGTPVSFLYCGQFLGFAVGWSQVNLDEYEEQYSLRHLLEWTAILGYKQRNFKYYEIGIRWYGPQLYKVPTSKELSIATFKERYGGQLWPNLTFEKFEDRNLFQAQYQTRLQEILDSNYFEGQSTSR